MKAKDLEAGTLSVSFLCKPQLKQDIEIVAALDGISNADVIRRAVLAEIRRRKQGAAALCRHRQHQQEDND